MKTIWGTVEVDENLDMFLGDAPVIAIDDEDPDLYLVTAEGGGYVARWVDETGVKHEKSYKSRAAAVRRAKESWGR